MIHLFEQHEALFRRWWVEAYEAMGNAYRLRLSAELVDDSQLAVREYVFADGRRKYAYQWMEADGSLRQRWDNAPHWPEIATAPHHTHLPGLDQPLASTLTNIEDLLDYIAERLGSIKR